MNFIYVFRFCFINVDIVYIHGAFYVSVIIVLVRPGGVYKYDSSMIILLDRNSIILQLRLEIFRLCRVLCGLIYNILKNVLYIFRFLYYINTKIRLYGYYYRACSIQRYTNIVHLFDLKTVM